MSDGNLLDSLEWFFPIRNVIYRVKDISAVISCPAQFADPDNDIFEDDKSLLMLESLARNLLWANCAFAVCATVAVR